MSRMSAVREAVKGIAGNSLASAAIGGLAAGATTAATGGDLGETLKSAGIGAAVGGVGAGIANTVIEGEILSGARKINKTAGLRMAATNRSMPAEVGARGRAFQGSNYNRQSRMRKIATRRSNDLAGLRYNNPGTFLPTAALGVLGGVVGAKAYSTLPSNQTLAGASLAERAAYMREKQRAAYEERLAYERARG